MAVPARPVCRPRATITSALGDAQEALQAAARQPVGGEDAMLELGQRVEVAALGVANADSGRPAHGQGVEDIVTSKGGPLIPASIAASPRLRIVRRALNPFAAGRDQRMNGGKRAATEQGKVPLCCNDAASSRRDRIRFNQVSPQPRPNRFHQAYRCSQGTAPRPEKSQLRSARAPPSTPASVKAARPDFIRAGLLCAREADARRREGAWRAARATRDAARP